MNGFGRVYHQSPIAGMSFTKGDIITLDLGFDELQIMKRDSISKSDSIKTPMMALASTSLKSKSERTSPAKPKIIQNPVTKSGNTKSVGVKPKASPEAIKKWKEKVAALKAKPVTAQKAKPNQAAIDRWKAKVAAQKALDKKNNKGIKKSTVQPKNPNQ